MQSERWSRIQDLYERAQKIDESERTGFLDEVCAGDADLRREVESLLGYAAEAENFMEAAPSAADSDVLPEGRELGAYRIVSLLGAGGMGKVYLAKDTRLGRTVAVKVLAHEKVADAERKRRFLQEARAASALNHPNIVTLYDIASDSGIDFLVMEYIEGESLHKRIPRRGLPINQALSYATQIVSALAAAHAAGIVHRDIKPANVVVTGNGQVKVLDFGLAKLSEALESSDPDAPTEATRTQKGVVLGTAAYMSPEQASGKPVDARSDIFAVGVVLYEMLTGVRAFDRGSVLATLGAVMYEEPAPLGEIVKTATPELSRIVERCLRKDPDRRIQTMADLKVALGELQEAPKSSGTATVILDKPRRRWVPLVAVSLVAVAAASAIFLLTRSETPPAALAAVVKPLTSVNGWEVGPSWSPDGAMVVFGNNANGNMDLFMMPSAGGEPVPLTNTPYDEVMPRWSPDFKYLAYVADPGTGAKVYLKPPLGVGGERLLAEAGLPTLDPFASSLPVLGTNPWSNDSQQLLYSRVTDSGGSAVWRIDVATKQQTQLTFPEPGGRDNGATWSFDGTRIAFNGRRAGRFGLWTIPAAGGEPSFVTEESQGAAAWSADSNRLVFISDRTGFRNVWEIDVVLGSLRQITSGPSWDQYPIVSRGGRLAYVSFGHQVDLYSIGSEPPHAEERLTFHSGENFMPSFSPNGRKLAYQSDRTGNTEIHLLDLDTKTERNLTDHPASDLTPEWSPDGREIVFISSRQGKPQVWVMDSEGGSPRLLTSHTVPADPRGWTTGPIAPRWSPDGKAIAFRALTESKDALWVVNVDGTNAKQILERVLYFDWYDSRHIIFLRRGANGPTQVHAVDILTNSETLLLPDPSIEFAVSRDRTKLLYTHAVSHFNMNLWFLPLRPGANGMPMPSGKPQQVTNGRSLWHVHKGEWSPDGKRIVYTRDADQGDVYTIENYR